MNKRNKIIVSIAGITIVLLALLGITYAYYLTRIEGNTNTNSISVTTAKLELVYGDNSAEILTGTGALTPSTDLTSAGAIGTKTFTVTNNGNDSSYVVIIDNVSIKNISDNTDTNFLSNDFRYTLTCTKSNNTKCNETTKLTTFPINGGILVGNNIDEGDIHSYTLNLWYIDTGIDQSDDMGKVYQARVNITDVNQMKNPFMTGVSATDSESLAYNIIKNAKSESSSSPLVATPPSNINIDHALTNYTESSNITYLYGDFNDETPNQYYFDNNSSPYKTCPNYNDVTNLSTVECVVSESCNNDLIGSYIFNKHVTYQKVIACNDNRPVIEKAQLESVMSFAQDDYGTSYYYRGAVSNNYVRFANMLWRIVRIQGDGSVKLLLDEVIPSGMGSWGTTTKTNGNNSYTALNYSLKSSGMADVFYDFQRTIAMGLDNSITDSSSQSEISEVLSRKMKFGDWCLNDKVYLSSSSDVYNDNPLTEYEMSEYALNRTLYYDSYIRLNREEKNLTLKCNGTMLSYWDDNINAPTPMYVGTITADEVIYGGINQKLNGDSGNLLIMSSYLITDNYYYTLSPAISDISNKILPEVYAVASNSIYGTLAESGKLFYHIASAGYPSYRPMIILKNDVKISSGTGTKNNPYVIN